MTPEDLKTLKIMMATFKFEIREIIEEETRELVKSALKERWRSEDTRRRGSTW
jgi:hypothetical protein